MPGGQYRSNRRTRQRGVPLRIRRIVLARANGMCEILGPSCSEIATDADHIVPVAEGGTDDLSNFQAGCPPCHKAKTQAEAARGRVRYGRRRPPVPHPADRWR